MFAMDALGVAQPGMLTTIQDLGRFGYQKYGISVSGAMDKFAVRVGNLLVGNDQGEAVIEMTGTGPILRLLSNLVVAFTGGDFCPAVNGKPVPMWQALTLKEGDIVSYGCDFPRSGFRAYMAINGGIDIPAVMGSRSTHLLSKLGGVGRPLVKGDLLRVKSTRTRPVTGRLNPEQIPGYPKIITVRVIPGPQDDYFTSAGMGTFFSGQYQITPKASRMGYRLEGPRIEHRHGADILSDATPAGSVQVPGDGMPIILLADGQTTGGYAKIGVVISPDQDKLAQASPGDKVNFQKVDVSEAHKIMGEVDNLIKEIEADIG
jgi:antagonist of KipI